MWWRGNVTHTTPGAPSPQPTRPHLTGLYVENSNTANKCIVYGTNKKPQSKPDPVLPYIRALRLRRDSLE